MLPDSLPSPEQPATVPLPNVVRSSLAVRWLVLAVVLASIPWREPAARQLAEFAAGVLAYTLLLQLVSVWRAAWFKSWALFGATLLCDYLAIGGLLWLSGGVHSPYFVLLTLPLLSVTYWQERSVVVPFAVLATVSAGLTVLTTFWPPALVVSYGRIAASASATASVLAAGLLLISLSTAERQTRHRLVAAERQAEAQQARLETFLNSISEAVVVVSSAGIITLCNAAALSLFNTHKLDGAAIDRVLPAMSDGGESVSILGLATGTSTVIERDDLRFTTYDGSTVSLHLSIAPVRGRLTTTQSYESAYVMVMRDITKAVDLERERDEFISVTSHELRTPVATAEASLALLLNPKLGAHDAQTLHYANVAHDNVVFLGELIADLSTLSRLERNELEIEVAEVAPATLLGNLADAFHASAQDKNLELKVEVAAALPPVLSSEYLVKEILHNFITNALKYTQKGGVTLAAVQSTLPDKGLTFSVRDTGIGIAASDKPHMFQKFFRSEDYRTRQTGGTGLGLYLNQRIAERLNGRIWFTSVLNEGSTFYLSVPPVSHIAGDRQKVQEAKLDNLVNNL